MEMPFRCKCGALVVEAETYDSSDQPYVSLFEMDAEDEISNKEHRCRLLED